MGFEVIKFQTSYGENCTATKRNGVVTISGDKHGVRQMKIDEFMQAFIRDQQKVNLERSPQADTVAFSGNGRLTEQKLGPAGFGPGHPQYEDKTKKPKGKLLLLATALVAAGAYVLTKGKAGGKAIAGLTDDAVRTGSRVVTSVTDDAARAGSRVVTNVTDDAVRTGSRVTVGAADDFSRAGTEFADDFGRAGTGFADDAVDISRRGSYGQDLYDPCNPLNYDDYLSPYYRNQNKGSYGQNLDDMFDPMNKLDPLSPYYDPTGLGLF